MRGLLNDLLAFARGDKLPSAASALPRARLTTEHAQTAESFSARLMALGITQAAFADLAEVTPRTVNNWVKGRTKINGAALVMLDMLERYSEVRRALSVGVKTTGAPRGRPFAPGNVYRFGDRRRRVAVAGARMARAAA